MNPIEGITNALDKVWLTYELAVDLVATRAQKKYINPWLDQMGYDLLCGNGTWIVIDRITRQHIKEETLPAEIRAILELTVEGFNSNDLGSLMDNYPE